MSAQNHIFSLSTVCQSDRQVRRHLTCQSFHFPLAYCFHFKEHYFSVSFCKSSSIQMCPPTVTLFGRGKSVTVGKRHYSHAYLL